MTIQQKILTQRPGESDKKFRTRARMTTIRMAQDKWCASWKVIKNKAFIIYSKDPEEIQAHIRKMGKGDKNEPI